MAQSLWVLSRWCWQIIDRIQPLVAGGSHGLVVGRASDIGLSRIARSPYLIHKGLLLFTSQIWSLADFINLVNGGLF